MNSTLASASHAVADAAADAALGAYQRYVSPHKGFRCAYRAHTGRRSCSPYARAIVQRLGAAALTRALPRQFARCKTAYVALATTQPGRPSKTQRPKRRWWEHCDCIPCDLPCHMIRRPGRCDGPGDCDIGVCDCSP